MQKSAQIKNSKQGKNMSNTNLKQWISFTELEAEYGFLVASQAKMRMMDESSTFPFSRIGNTIRYDRHKVDQWLEEHSMCSNLMQGAA